MRGVDRVHVGLHGRLLQGLRTLLSRDRRHRKSCRKFVFIAYFLFLLRKFVFNAYFLFLLRKFVFNAYFCVRVHNLEN